MEKLLFLAAVAALAWLVLRKPARPRLPDAEAREVLGVSRDAGPDEIRAAHRRLAAAVHPDKGGSADLTRRINAARDTLLRRRN